MILGFGSIDKSENSFFFNLKYPAIAIIAALSVQYSKSGKIKFKLYFS